MFYRLAIFGLCSVFLAACQESSSPAAPAPVETPPVQSETRAPFTLSPSVKKPGLNERVLLNPAGGAPPYTFEVIDGPAKLDHQSLIASEPGTTILRASDSRGETVVSKLKFHASLSLHSDKTRNGWPTNLSFLEKIELSAEGGVPPYVFSLVKGHPPDMSIDADSGIVQAGRQEGSFRVKVKDAQGTEVESLYWWIYSRPGALDPSFGKSGISDLDKNYVSAMAVGKDDSLITAGSGMQDIDFRAIRVSKYTPNGELDKSFGTEGSVELKTPGIEYSAGDLEIYADGKILLLLEQQTHYESGPKSWNLSLRRFLSTGEVDATFGDKGVLKTQLYHSFGSFAIAIQPDEKILLAGKFIKEDELTPEIIRFHPNGSPDASFGKAGRLSLPFSLSSPHSLLLQGDGRILITGRTDSKLEEQKMGVLRLDPDGAYDRTFGKDGVLLEDIAHRPFQSEREGQSAEAIIELKSGNLLVAGLVRDAPFLLWLSPSGEKLEAIVLAKEVGKGGFNGMGLVELSDGSIVASQKLHDYGNENPTAYRILADRTADESFRLTIRDVRIPIRHMQLPWWRYKTIVGPVLQSNGRLLFPTLGGIVGLWGADAAKSK